MKALTLYQPWATLMAIGAKTVETRSWYTLHRGPLAIHAGKSRKYLDLVHTEPFRTVLVGLGFSGQSIHDLMPLGAVVAIVNVTGCYPTAGFRMDESSGMHEGDFGDYSPDRYAWETDPTQLVRIFPAIRAIGHQGLWDWDPPKVST